MSRAYRAALICGAAPLFVGTAIFLLWLVTHWDGLMLAGLFTLYAGLAAFALGVVCLAISPEKRRLRPLLVCATILLVNSPAAIAIIAAVIAIETRYTVVVENASREPLEGVRVTGGGCDVDFGTIAPGASASRSMSFREDGPLQFHANSGTTIHASIIESYVTGSMGGYTTVRINPDLRITLIPTRND